MGTKVWILDESGPEGWKRSKFDTREAAEAAYAASQYEFKKIYETYDLFAAWNEDAEEDQERVAGYSQ